MPRKFALAASAAAILALLICLWCLWLSRDSTTAPGAGDAAPGALDSAGSEAPRASDSAVALNTGAESSPVGAPAAPEAAPAPVLAGRILGEGQGIAGASVLFFSVSEIEALIFRLERIIASAGENVRVPELLRTIRFEFEGIKNSALSVTTDETGFFELRTERRGGQLVLAYAREWLFHFGEVVHLEDGRTAELVVALERGARISGRVVGAEREPVAGIRVLAEYRPAGSAGIARLVRRALRWVNGEFLKGPFETATDAGGDFTIPALHPGTYDLLAYDASGLESYLPNVETGSSANVIYFGAGAAISGTLIDNFGRPLKGVALQLERIDETLSLPAIAAQFNDVAQLVNRHLGDPPRSVKSGESGEFSIRPLGAGNYRLTIDERGFFPYRKTLSVDWSEEVELAAIELYRGLTIRGIVRAKDGEPIAGAEVRADPEEADFVNFGNSLSDFLTGRTRADTRADGAFVLQGLRKGKYRLHATAKDYVEGTLRGLEPQEEPVLIELDTGFSISGRVLTTDGAPIASARVKIGSRVTESDRDGAFDVCGIEAPDMAARAAPVMTAGEEFENEAAAPAALWLEATAKGFHPERLELPLPALPPAVEVRLEAASEIAGIVLNPNGEPALGALVRIVPVIPEADDLIGIGDAGLIFLGVTATGIDGRFRFHSYHVAEGGDFQIIADHLLYSRAASEPFQFEMMFAEPHDFELKLKTPSRISGTITDGAEPIAGAIVRLTKPRVDSQQVAMAISMFGFPKPGKTAHTDSAGNYSFDKQAPGDYVVTAEKVGFEESPEQTITLEEGKSARADFVLDAGGVIEGVVVDERDQPISEATVRILRDGDGLEVLQMQRVLGSGYKVSTTGADGGFRFEGLPENSFYFVIAAAKGYGAGERESVRASERLAPIVLERAADFRGKVVDAATGRPVAAFKVQFVAGKGSPSIEDVMEYGGIQVEDAAGEFERTGVAAGNYSATIRAAGYATQSSEVVLEPGVLGEKIFALRKAGTLRGRVTNEKQEGIAYVQVAARNATRAPAPESDEDAVLAHWSAWRAEEHCQTDANGAYAFASFPDGKCHVEFSHEEYVTQSTADVEVTAGGEEVLDIELAAGLTLGGVARSVIHTETKHGMLFLRGLDAANRQIRKRTSCGEDGRFRFAGLAPGRYRIVSVEQPGELGMEPVAPVEVELTGDRDDVVVPLP